MRTIHITVTADEDGNKLQPDRTIIGYAGEHLATNLVFDLPQSWVDEDYTYYVSIDNAAGASYRSAYMSWPVSIILPGAVTIAGPIYLQVIALGTEDVLKSARIQCMIGQSNRDGTDIPDNPTVGLIDHAIQELLSAVTISPPYIGDNGNWYVYDVDAEQYKDTGLPSMGSLNAGSVDTDHISNAAITDAKLSSSIQARLNNQITGVASGSPASITDGIRDTGLISLVIIGNTSVLLEGLIPTSLNIVSDNQTSSYTLPVISPLYATPDASYYDTYDVVQGLITRSCSKTMLNTLTLYAYSLDADTVTCISGMHFVPLAQMYRCIDGKVTLGTVNWQGQIEIKIQKTLIGITSDDTATAAQTKLREYLSTSYVIAPLKIPTIDYVTPQHITMPSASVIVSADAGTVTATYLRNINSAYLDLIAYTTELEARLAQLEIFAGGGDDI